MSTQLLDHDNISAACESIAAASIIAVDTEFHAERRYIPELYLVQVHVPGGPTWIADGMHTELLSQLGTAMLQPNWLVHGGEQDMRLLYRKFGGLPPQVYDTQIGAALASSHHFPAGLGKLVERYLGLTLPKQETLSDWSRRPLTEQQLDYAVEDVLLLPQLWDEIMGAIECPIRQQAVETACQEARLAVISPAPLDVRWTTIAGAGKLSRQQLAVLQELSAWREETAIKLNQPTRSVLSDNLLCGFAKNQPQTVEQIRKDRRIPKNIIKKYGEEIVEGVQRASQRPEWAWPRHVQRDTSSERMAQFLRTASHAIARDRSVAANLLLPTKLINTLATVTPTSPEALNAELGWRHAIIGDVLWTLLNGKTSLIVQDGEVHLRS